MDGTEIGCCPAAETMIIICVPVKKIRKINTKQTNYWIEVVLLYIEVLILKAIGLNLQRRQSWFGQISGNERFWMAKKSGNSAGQRIQRKPNGNDCIMSWLNQS